MTTAKQPVFLRVFKDGKLLEVKQFTSAQIVLGREGQVDLAVDDPNISPIHAMIEEREDGKYHLCDLGGASGTVFKGEKVVDTPIVTGDEFQLGGCTIEFHIGIPKAKSEDVAPTASPQPPSTPKASTPPPAPADAAPVTKPLVHAAPPPSGGVKKKAPKKAPGMPKKPAAPAAAPAGLSVDRPQSPSVPPLKGTFAPASSATMHKNLKPSAGAMLEVILSWHDRVLNTYHYSKKQTVKVGSHPDNQIVLPVFGSVKVAHPLIDIGDVARVFLTQDMTGELVRENDTTTFDELRRSGKLQPSGAGFTYVLQQKELMRITIGEGVQITIRYVESPPPAALVPMVDPAAGQMPYIVLALLAMGLFLFWVFLYAPEPKEPEDDEEPLRKVKFVYKAPKVPMEKVTSRVKKTIKTKNPPAPSNIEEGKASEAKPNKSKSKKRILTGPKRKKSGGKRVSSGPKKKRKKDVSKSGLLSAFGTKGIQDQLNRAYKGSGNVAGLSDAATGSASDRAGSGPGSGGFRETGMGGKGTATVGIAGVNTRGRGGGVKGYGTGGIGGKRNATIIAGDGAATFTGSIDREAVRRVVKAGSKQLKACFERGLNRDPSLYGKVVIQWTIVAGGKAIKAKVKSSTMNAPKVERCMVNRLRTWKFPEPPVGTAADISYPFVFSAQD